jgi:prepilin-type N-terminal cleavage/methylation domain-containing protein
MNFSNEQSGFTLIETIVYIALLAIIIGGGMIGVYNILEGSGRTRQAMYREQEAYFITRKVDAVLSEATSVTIPSISLPSSNSLVVQTDGGPITINLFGEQINLQRGAGDQHPLNDTLVPVTALNFERNNASGTITTTFTLDEHSYSVSNYIR